MRRFIIHSPGKRIFTTTVLFLLAAVFVTFVEKEVRVMAAAYYQEDIGERLIRLHVLANSDSDADQQLKLKVKEDIVNFAEPLFAESQSIDETRTIIAENMDNFKKVASPFGFR